MKILVAQLGDTVNLSEFVKGADIQLVQGSIGVTGTLCMIIDSINPPEIDGLYNITAATPPTP